MSEVKPSEYGLIECADGLKRMGEVKGGGWYSASDYDALAAKFNDPEYPPKHSRRLIEQLRTERDAALAELSALKGGHEAVAWAVCREPGKVDALSAAYASESAAKAHVNSYATKGCSGLHVTPLYTSPPAQASAWVPVSERLPVHLELVLVWLAYSDDEGERQETIDFADFHAPSQDNQWFSPYAFSAEQHPHVTHWQPITTPTPGASDGKGGQP